ncbi:monooxygenase [Marinibaculum pumilum]|uniref:Monooxygenase n=1 Tax=Marinibaculum pumilum TaxID=1766165 RepID=A0ABV7L8J2_9PROT
MRRIAILGAGPAGLYAGYLLKRAFPDLEVDIREQNPADATFGFGVVFSDRALEFLREDDPGTHASITPHMEVWDDLTVHHRGEAIRIDGIGFSAIGRLHLLQLLQERARSVGLRPVFERPVESLDELGEADLVIGADGVNSLLRRHYADGFGAQVEELRNRFVWYGTDRPFDTLSQTFVATEDGAFNAHHYRYTPQMSTFIVETTPEVWERAGFAAMDDAQTRAYCEAAFADSLQGAKLISNRSIWRRFPQVGNDRWWLRDGARHAVLIGDALRTAHFSIGSGTRLALEDAIALVRALRDADGDLAAGLAAFEAARRPVVDKLVAAALSSARWYEAFDRHMALAPWDFAYSYIRRAGRVSDERLRQVAPRFMAGCEASRDAGAGR